MNSRIIIIVILLGMVLLLAPLSAQAQAPIVAANNRATIAFPASATFSVDLTSDTTISQVTLEYGVDKMTCSNVMSSAIPQFTPGKIVTAKWTWEMRQTGSEPPGAQMWWRWRVKTDTGKELVTDRQTVTWLDSEHPWQTIKGERVNLHWYRGANSFATDLSNSADKSLVRLAEFVGLTAVSTPDVYIYGTYDDVRAAVLFAPSWMGGQAYYEYNIVILGVPINQSEWGRGAIAHELTHVLDLRATYSCPRNRPTWLTEGLAMVGEGGLTARQTDLYNKAITDDKLISVRSLTGGFSEISDVASQSYAQSWSIVNFLLNEYGKDKFWVMLRSLQNGNTIDNALRSAYSFDSDGLEDVWRAKIGAKPRANAGQSAVVTTPTAIPTAALVAGFQFPTRTPTVTSIPPTPTQVAMVVPAATVATVAEAAAVLQPSGAPTALIVVGLIIAAMAAIAVVVLRKRK